MKKLLLLIILIVLGIGAYLFTQETPSQTKKVLKPKEIQPETKIIKKEPKKKEINIDYSKLELEKELIKNVPTQRVYEKEKYLEVKEYKEQDINKKSDGFDISTDVDIDTETKEINGGKIEISKDF